MEFGTYHARHQCRAMSSRHGIEEADRYLCDGRYDDPMGGKSVGPLRMFATVPSSGHCGAQSCSFEPSLRSKDRTDNRDSYNDHRS